VALNSCSVYTRMTAGQLPGNLFELATIADVMQWHAEFTAETP